MRRLCIILLGLFLVSNIEGAILLDFNHYNTRFYGTGEALLVEKNDLNNLEIFPASIARVKDNEISTGYINWLDYINLYKLTYAKRIGAFDVIAGSINFANLKEINNYDETGNIIGNLKNNDFGVTLGYGILLERNIQIGVNVKYINMRITDYIGNWLGMGLSAIMGFKIPGVNILKKENLNVGIGIQNLNIMQAKFDSQKSSYPAHINTGFVYKVLRINKIYTKIGSTLDYVTKYNKAYLSTGLEVNWNELIYIRTGCYIIRKEFDTVNLGLGIKRNIAKENVVLKFDYSIGFIEDDLNHFTQLSIGF